MSKSLCLIGGMLSSSYKRASASVGGCKKRITPNDSTIVSRSRGTFHSHDIILAVDQAAGVADSSDGSALDICVSHPVHPHSPSASSHDDLESPMRPAALVPLPFDAVPPGSPRNGVKDVVPPASPGGNRDRFMANCQPLKVSCDLSHVGLFNASMRFSFQAVVLIVYPASTKPDRRHLQLIDSRGSTGLTVWGPHVALFSSASVGQVVRISRLSLIVHQGKKGLSLGRDSTVIFVDVKSACEESKWWQSLLNAAPLRVIDVHDCEDDQVICVSGIVGTLSTETKRVKDDDKELLCMRLTDSTGYVDVRSWCHSEAELARFREHPLLLKRVRVTSFGGMKILELLDGSGTAMSEIFIGAAELRQYWAE